MSRPHPSDFTVDISQRPDGGWRVQIQEVPAFWGEGGCLREALGELRKRALPRVAATESPGMDTLRGAAAVFAAENAAERYLELQDGVVAVDEGSAAWDDVSVISRRKTPSSRDPTGDTS